MTALMSEVGTWQPIKDVRSSIAVGGKADEQSRFMSRRPNKRLQRAKFSDRGLLRVRSIKFPSSVRAIS